LAVNYWKNGEGMPCEMANGYIPDSSALIALMEEEDGHETVADLLRQEKIIIPYIVLMEVYYISLRESGQQEADRRWAMIKRLPVEFVWGIDEATVRTAARFKALHRVSFADAIIAAYAKSFNAILVHKDPEYEALAGEVELLSLPFKGTLMK
jgi:predicted nucleic acid-binding protein